MSLSAPLKGHSLLYEGGVWRRLAPARALRLGEPLFMLDGGCECGAKPDGFPDMTRTAMRRFHAGHKAEVRRRIIDAEVAAEFAREEPS